MAVRDPINERQVANALPGIVGDKIRVIYNNMG